MIFSISFSAFTAYETLSSVISSQILQADKLIDAGVFDSASIADTFIVSVPVICLL